MAYKQLLIVCALVFAFGPARSQVIVVDGNKATKENNRNAAISDATAEDEARFGSQLDPLEYFINVTIRNYASSEAKVQQRYLFPDGAEIKSFTLHNDGHRAKRSAENQRLTQWVGGMVNLKPSDTKEAYMTYINHPAEVINVNTKTFHRLSTTIMIKEGDLVGGQISSPNYPVSYPNGADVTWLIAYPENNRVMLQILDYATEECCDHVFVYDGHNQSRRPLATFEGYYSYGSDNIVLSTQPAMFIRFTSDCLVTNRGFLASYINQPVMSCGSVQEINGNQGYIRSPNYPGTYDDDMNCTWSVQTYYNTRVRFVLDNFTIGYDDRVTIYEGTPGYPGNSIAVLYGSYSGYTVDASSYQAFVVFTSGSSSYYSDMFIMSYEGVSNYPETTTSATMSCGYIHTTNGNSGYIESPNYPNTYDPYMYCTWYVQTHYNTRVTFVVDNMYIGSDDRVTFYEGSHSNPGDLIATLSGGGYYGNTYYALSNQAYVQFSSGYSSYYYDKFNISYYGEYAPETTVQTIGSCGDVYYTDTYAGYIYSPNYPDTYPPNSDCTWTVATDSGTELTFSVQYFNLRSGDYVYIYGGTPADTTYSRSMTGYYSSGYRIYVESNEAFLRFVSDSYTYSGYSFRFYFYGTTREGSGDEGSGGNYYNPAMCNGNSQSISGSSGYIYSSGYYSPGYYPMNEYCIWYISTYSYYNSITFYTYYLSTEYGYDWVRIYNGYSTSTNDLISQMSGYVSSYSTIAVTNSRYATLTFTSDNIITDYGYRIGFYGDYYYTTASPIEETTVSDSCPTEYYGGYSGYVESPNYPSNYDINMFCNTYVNTPYGTYVQLSVQSFYLGSGDYLRIYNGFNGDLLITLTGYYSYSYSWTASTNYIRLAFYSDSAYTGSGYQFRYDAVYGYDNYYTAAIPSTCGGAMPFNSGTITSPNYPNNYDNNLDCVWTVTVNSNMYVLFTVVYFDTESGFDYVGFYGGTPENSYGQFRTLNGYVNSGYEILISYNQAYVTFHTDGSVTDMGFSINYNAASTYYAPAVNAAANDKEHDVFAWWKSRELEAEAENGPKTLGKDLWKHAKDKPEHLRRKIAQIPELNEIPYEKTGD